MTEPTPQSSYEPPDDDPPPTTPKRRILIRRGGGRFEHAEMNADTAGQWDEDKWHPQPPGV